MDKIVWQEGMLLRPQHLQQQDRYYQQQTRHLLQTATPNNWGFFEIAIDQQYLMMGKIVIPCRRYSAGWNAVQDR